MYTAAAEGKIMYFPIEGLMNDEVITDATVYVTGYSGGGGHADLPALMPGICVIRRRRSTGEISSLQSGGFVLDTSGGAAGPVAPWRSHARSACVFARDLAILAPHPAILASHRPPCYVWLHPGAPRLGNVAPLMQAMVECPNPKP